MREHLYRAQRVDNKEWIEGFPIFYRANQTGIAQIHSTTRIQQVEGNDYFDITDLFCPKIIPATLCEYTGLTDKNGVQIFEGDIVKVKDTLNWGENGTFVGSVGFGDASFRIETDISSHYRWQDYDCEVIGTIFDEGERE